MSRVMKTFKLKNKSEVKSLAGQVASIHYWVNGFKEAAWKHSLKLRKRSGKNHQAIQEALLLLDQAQKKIDSVYQPELGRGMIKEIRRAASKRAS